MAYKLCAKWWITSRKQLEDLTIKDAIWREQAVDIRNRHLANNHLGNWYLKYIQLFKDLDMCVGLMAQPQRRTTAKKLLDAATLRLLDFKDALRQLDFSEYHYIDDNLIEYKVIPHDIEILHPQIFCLRPVDIEDMWIRIKKGEKIYLSPEEQEEKAGLEEVEAKKRRRRRSDKKFDLGGVQRTSEEIRQEHIRLNKLKTAILRIQTAERCRQERFFFFIKLTELSSKKSAKQQALERRISKRQQKITESPEETAHKKLRAIIRIQSYWRGYNLRKTNKKVEIMRRVLLGMYQTNWRSNKQFVELDAAIEKRREYIHQRMKDYVEAVENEKARILRVVAPGLMEDIGDEIREWFREWYYKLKKFDTFPAEKLGGTCLVITGETMTPKEYLKRKAYEEEVGKEGLRQDKKREEAAEKKKKQRLDKQLKEEKVIAEEIAFKRMTKIQNLLPNQYAYFHDPPAALDFYNEAKEEYDTFWASRDMFQDGLEKPYMDVITEKHCYDTQIECRRIVDELMRVEYDILQAALAKDHKRKYKAKKRKRPKPEKPGNIGDPTFDRSVEDLFQELVNNGIIRTYPKVSLDEFHGDFRYYNWEARKADFDPDPGLLDVRQAVVMNCILPLGVGEMSRPRSVLITGTPQSGKHILANAVFNATRCVLFDLSPERTAGKYEGKDIKMLLHLVNKMSKILAPSIIFIDGAERLFYKRVPRKEKRLDPKRCGAILKKIINDINPPDRVMVLGITKKPFDAGAELKTIFDRHILIPLPDYNSIYMFWHEILMPYYGVNRDFNFSVLTRVTVGYLYTSLKQAIKGLLNIRRRMALEYKPLTALEVYNYLLENRIEPFSQKKWKKYLKWFKKTELLKKRTKYLKYVKMLQEKEKK